MTTKINSAAVVGLDGVGIEVETDITPGLPTFIIVGLPDTAIQEARERVKSAIKNSGFSFPKGRVAVNLAPADTPKTGTAYDLPIAISILHKAGLINAQENLERDHLFVGELSLDGRIRPANGILPITIFTAREQIKNVFVPKENEKEAALVKGVNIFPVSTLAEIIAHLEGRVKLQSSPPYTPKPNGDYAESFVDISDIAGHQAAKHALTIAAAGHHNMLFTGPPGSGKTMLAKALRGILPPLEEKEMLEVTKIYSISGLLKKDIIMHRSFRSPHHTSSRIALVGGGSTPKPGEVTLAHRGVLFLDEFPEFPRSTLEALRQPLEDGMVTVSRASATMQFPAEFILVAAQNPCPCGNLGNPNIPCQCSDGAVRRYKNRISGPILDRIDLVVDVPHLPYDQLKTSGTGETSQQAREKIKIAKERQRHRFNSGKTNSRMSAADIRIYCRLDEKTEKLISTSLNRYHFSPRAYHRLLKVSRTIADLADRDDITYEDVSQAIQFRWKNE